MQHLSPYQLGATLYMPATRDDITDVILRNKINGLRSLVICLEDAVSDKDIPYALKNLKLILSELSVADREGQSTPLTFIRPRNPEMGRMLVNDYDLSCIDGFVLPKFTQQNLTVWAEILTDTHLLWMPTLETEEVFDPIAMRELAFVLDAHPCKHKILAIRIGGNDLMNVISLRRSRTSTLYDGPLGYVFKMLVSSFSSKGFALTAPVCELIDQPGLLQEELHRDIELGLVAKTAIHPTQIAIIHNALAVERQDYDDALRIVNSEQAVFKSNGTMCEPATHRKWAQNILMRAKYFGVRPSATSIAFTM